MNYNFWIFSINSEAGLLLVLERIMEARLMKEVVVLKCLFSSKYCFFKEKKYTDRVQIEYHFLIFIFFFTGKSF